MKEKIETAKKWLQSYMKLVGYGFAGRLLSPESKEFRKYQKDHPNYEEHLLTWCVQQALEALEE